MKLTEKNILFLSIFIRKTAEAQPSSVISTQPLQFTIADGQVLLHLVLAVKGGICSPSYATQVVIRPESMLHC